MKINPNLYRGLNHQKRTSSQIDPNVGYGYFGMSFEHIDNLINGEIYTISFEMKQDERGCGQFNAGQISNKGSLAERDVHDLKDRSAVSLTINTDENKQIAIYTDLINLKNRVGAEIKNIKIEKGDQMTPYLPHKRKVKAENQAIFPPEGDYTEISPI